MRGWVSSVVVIPPVALERVGRVVRGAWGGIR